MYNRRLKGHFHFSTLLTKSYALAYFLGISRGIETVFRMQFPHSEELHKQRPEVGKILNLEHENQHICDMMTKKSLRPKPTNDALGRSLLISLKERLFRLEMERPAIPKLGCGYVGLEWSTEMTLVRWICQYSRIEILVYIKPLRT